MPPKRGGRNTRTKAPPPKQLTPEEQQMRDQCDLLLKDFDKQCQNHKLESGREAQKAAESIGNLYRLELMKIAVEIKAMKWEEYYAQNNTTALAVSSAVSTTMDDSVLEAVQSKVSQLKSAIKSTTCKKGRNKKQLTNDTEQDPPPTVAGGRTSSRRRNASSKENLETPAMSSRTKSALETPANSRLPQGPLATPMITPKFDTSSLSRTVSRVAKAGEVLVSLSGSPVAPIVGAKTKAAKEIHEQNALIPLGDGNTLNVPITQDGLGVEMAMDLDNGQMAKIEELHRSLGNMLKMRDQNRTTNSSS